MEKKDYGALDICKFFMMIVVIGVHTGLSYGCKNAAAIKVISFFSNICVPVFFIIAGFLLGNKLQDPFSHPENQKIMGRYTKKILKMYLVWMLIYTPIAIGNFLKHGTILRIAVWLYLRGLFFLGEQFNSFQLWYLLSTVYAMGLIVLLSKKGANLEQTVVAGILVTCFAVFFDWFVGAKDSFSGVLGRISQFLSLNVVSSRVLTGCTYLPIGMLLAKRKPGMTVAAVILIAGIGLMVFAPPSRYYRFYIVPAATGLVGVLVNVTLPESSVYRVLRQISTVGYLIHMYVYTVFYWIVYRERTYGLVPFAATTAITLLIAGMYTFFSRKIRNNS